MAISCGARRRATGTTRTPGNADNTRRQNGQSKTVRGSLNPEILPESSRVRIKERPRCTYSSGTCSAQSSQRPSVARKAATASSVSGKSSRKPWIRVCTARVNSRSGIVSKYPYGLVGRDGRSSQSQRERPCSIKTLAVRLEPLRCIESRMTSVVKASSMNHPADLRKLSVPMLARTSSSGCPRWVSLAFVACSSPRPSWRGQVHH
jgi:hypothetical protein